MLGGSSCWVGHGFRLSVARFHAEGLGGTTKKPVAVRDGLRCSPARSRFSGIYIWRSQAAKQISAVDLSRIPMNLSYVQLAKPLESPCAEFLRGEIKVCASRCHPSRSTLMRFKSGSEPRPKPDTKILISVQTSQLKLIEHFYAPCILITSRVTKNSVATLKAGLMGILMVNDSFSRFDDDCP